MILIKDDSVRFKRLTPGIVRAFPVIEKAFGENAPGHDVVITSANDGHHMAGSYHYTDYAVDVRSHGLTADQKNKILVQIKVALGPDYDALSEVPGTENEHFHVEFNARQK